MIYDFATILPFFGQQILEVEEPVEIPVDSDTGYSTRIQEQPTIRMVQAVIFPVESWNNLEGTQLLGTGAFQAGDYLVFVSANPIDTMGRPLIIKLFGEGQIGTVWRYKGKRYGTTKVWDFSDSGNFCVYLVSCRPVDEYEPTV